MPPAQNTFNQIKAKHFFREAKGKVESPIYHPPNVLKSGCDPAHIGLGALHIHAPKMFLGLPHTPCPYCKSWASVDDGKVTVKGTCPARRVYADARDEWLVGPKMVCAVCRDARSRLTAQLEEVEEDDEVEDDVIDAIRKERDATHYSYRSYNATSTRMYAERYPWCAESREPAHALSDHASRVDAVVDAVTGTWPRCRTSWSTTRRR